MERIMCTSSIAIATPFLLVIYAFRADAQIAAMFGIATQASNCGEWTPWGPCIWIKGNNPRWQRSYFDQLLPGRTGCREHIFFKLLRDRWGLAFNNFYNYLREITISEEQCGQCSYQQSCGRECHRRGSLEAVNLLFVAERICADVVQSTACTSKFVEGCRHWPNPNIPLPNVTKPMLDIVNNIEYLNCIPQKRADGDVCRCCCFPFAPNPTTFQCELKTVVVKPPLPPI